MTDDWQYIDIPKTASTSIRQALGGTYDAGYTLHWPAAEFPDVNHLAAVVREPLDRLVSCFAWMVAKDRPCDVAYFRRWVAEGLQHDGHTLRTTGRDKASITSFQGLWFALPQITWLVERVELLRFDELPQCMYQWCGQHGISCMQIVRENVSIRLPTDQYYDGPTERRCRDMFAEDFEMWKTLAG